MMIMLWDGGELVPCCDGEVVRAGGAAQCVCSHTRVLVLVRRVAIEDGVKHDPHTVTRVLSS